MAREEKTIKVKLDKLKLSAVTIIIHLQKVWRRKGAKIMLQMSHGVIWFEKKYFIKNIKAMRKTNGSSVISFRVTQNVIDQATVKGEGEIHLLVLLVSQI